MAVRDHDAYAPSHDSCIPGDSLGIANTTAPRVKRRMLRAATQENRQTSACVIEKAESLYVLYGLDLQPFDCTDSLAIKAQIEAYTKTSTLSKSLPESSSCKGNTKTSKPAIYKATA